jgi:hypothetical protein
MSVLTRKEIRPNVTLAGVSPANADVATWTDGDQGVGIGTDSSCWWMYKQGAVVKYVELIGVPQ